MNEVELCDKHKLPLQCTKGKKGKHCIKCRQGFHWVGQGDQPMTFKKRRK